MNINNINVRSRSKEKYLYFFYRDLALLHGARNKRISFFAEMASRMDDKQVVNMTANQKKKIMKLIDPDSKDPLNAANQYLKTLVRINYIRSMGGGDYMINPGIFGRTNFRDDIEKRCSEYISITRGGNKRKNKQGLSKALSPLDTSNHATQ
ncbi:MAG: hypothetical protein OEX82_05640 [Nitrosomonas sp.]|nr:hypothetical protein [Nitrosomonas sp.]